MTVESPQMMTIRTKSFLESSGCRTRSLKTSGYQPRLTQMGEDQIVFQFGANVGTISHCGVTHIQVVM